MRYEFEVTGPVTIDAMTRSSDLEVVVSDDAAVVSVDVDPVRGSERLVEATRVEMAANRLTIDVPRSEGSLFRPQASVTVRVVVPPGTSVEVVAGSGDIRGRGVLARAEIKTGSGDVALDAVEDMRVVTGSGDLSTNDVGQLNASSGSGDVRLHRVSGQGRVTTGSGDIYIADCADLTGSTGSGDIVIERLQGAVTFRTASGDLVVRSAVAGDLQVTTASGDVLIGIEQGTAALLDCRAVSGRVSSDLEASDAPEGHVDTLMVRCRSVSGDIRVQRA